MTAEKKRHPKLHKNLADAYRHYLTISGDVIVTPSLFVELNILYFQFLLNKICNGITVELHARLGKIGFIGRKAIPKIDSDGKLSGVSVDWNSTMELWERDPAAKDDNRQERPAHSADPPRGAKVLNFPKWEVPNRNNRGEIVE